MGAQCQLELEVSVELWWLHDNEREQGHDSGQVTPERDSRSSDLGGAGGCDWGCVRLLRAADVVRTRQLIGPVVRRRQTIEWRVGGTWREGEQLWEQMHFDASA